MRLIQHVCCVIIRRLWNLTAYQQINHEWEQVLTNIVDGKQVTKSQVQTMTRAWESYFNTNDVALEVPLLPEYWTTLEGVSDYINMLPRRERIALITTLMDDLVGELYNESVLEDDSV